MTLGGLVKHVALVEADWLAVKLAGQAYGPPVDAVDFDADPDWEVAHRGRVFPEGCSRCGEPLSNARVRSLPTSSPNADWTGRHRSPGRMVDHRLCGTCCWT